MKLWQKIFLITLAFVMTAVSATAVFVAQSYFSVAVEQERASAEAQHEYYSTNIRNKISYERLRSGEFLLSSDEIYSVVTEFLSSYSDSKIGIAVYDELSEISSDNSDVISSAPELLKRVRTSEESCSQIKDFGNKTYLLIGSPLSLEGQSYYVFTADDITHIYTERERMLGYVRVLSLIFAVASAVILLIVVYRLLRPLTEVNSSIRTIAGGDYSARVDERGGREFRELASNVNIMAAAIETNVENLQNIADSRKRFIDNLAHEMKTPLTSIVCLADVLRIKKDISEDELREYSGIIVDEAKRLKGLSGKLLELTVAGNAELELRELNVTDLLTEVENSVRPIAKKRNIKLSFSPVNTVILADRDLFVSLLYNLIDNAIKASDAGQEIEIDCSLGGNSLAISVKDCGVGMSEDEIKKITEPFYMVDKSRSRREGGAGLGLSLCVEIAKRHGARLDIESEPGAGTTVSVIIPTGGGSDE